MLLFWIRHPLTGTCLRKYINLWNENSPITYVETGEALGYVLYGIFVRKIQIADENLSSDMDFFEIYVLIVIAVHHFFGKTKKIFEKASPRGKSF